MEGRYGLKAGAVVTFAALIACTSAATTSFAVEPTEVTIPTPLNLEDGRYIVLLEDEPVATYEGGEAGLAATKPAEGAKLDATTDAAVEYSTHLENVQTEIAAEAGVTADNNLTITLNAFTANLTASQAKRLAATDGVSAVVPDEIFHPTAVPSTEFLKLEGDGGVWETYTGGIEGAGEGVVVGVIDTGIAPENPSFAGDPLGTVAGDEPYLEGNTVVFTKGDGTQFRSDIVEDAEEWNSDYYSTKLIAAHYFSAGAAAAGFSFAYDYLSPRDGAGHGSHTASTAAGNYGVDATVGGMDFGAISGVAPAAKIAAYKVCYEGPDPSVTSDDICAGSDLLAAIDQATEDGVDVINFSIGGGAATTVLDTLDVAFFNAAVAGVFVSASAGNSGPDYVTADHASPWYTTVAASTIPTYEGTVVSGDFEAPGAAITVPADGLTGDAVYAGDVLLSGASATDGALCYPNTLDPAKVSGKIVVCDRGGNARVEKSQSVLDAGGIGMVLVNVTPGSLDTDFHSVPTVHISDTYRDDLLAAVAANGTVTLLPQNDTETVTPTPQVAGFSSRGPMLADGSDILKPDVAAPGVNILAAINNGQDEAPQWGLMSGTSMAAPHVAGLAALYLGVHPDATPGEVKSALMTTSYNTVNEDGTDNVDPFAQGAGQVDATKYFHPGLIYNNGPADWAAFLVGKGLADFDGIEPIDGSDLNLASISIGALAGTQTVTRTVTAETAGTYTATVDVPGVNVTVEPSSITLAEGETATFTVTFENDSAATDAWATGFLTWSNGEIDVRSPIAVFPTAADAPAELFGEGVEGTIDYSITPGADGDLPLVLSGLTPYTLHEDPDNPVPGHTGNENSGDVNGDVAFAIELEEGADLVRFDLDSSDDAGSDLDLTVYHLVSDTQYDKKWDSATGSADEQVTVVAPAAGVYFIVVNVYSTTGPMTWDFRTAVVAGAEEGALTATPNPIAAQQAVTTPVSLSWTGLETDTRYLGLVQYGESAVTSVVTVDAGPAAPVNTAPPVLSGTGVVGDTLTASTGEWDQEGLTFKYEWLKDGAPIVSGLAQTAAVPAEATDNATYTPTAADEGATISVRVYATQADNPNVGSAVTNGIVVTAASETTPPVETTEPGETTPPAGGGGGSLPVTGTPDATVPMLVGFLIVALGGAAFFVGRQRRAHAE